MVLKIILLLSMLKTVLLLNIIVETDVFITAFFDEYEVQRTAFIWIFYKKSVIFDQFDLALLNRNIIFFKKSVIIIMYNNIKK